MKVMNLQMMKAVGKATTKIAVKTGMKLRKISPELMLVGGIVAGTAAIVTACVATKKAVEDKVVEKAHGELDDIQMELVEGVEDIDTPKGKRRESFRVYRKLIFELAKRFGPSVFLFLLSMGLFLGSHGVLKKRYVSTTIAYKALDEAFRDYRRRVKEAVGEENELHLFNGTEERGEKTVIDENGETTTTKDIVKVHEKKYSPYEFDFNMNTAPGNWDGNSEYNLMFLRGVQNYFTDLLRARGHVFMNEVLDALGIKRTREGAVVGWMLGKGDDYVDFGISQYYSDEFTDIQDGCIRNIHINFNVDGLIWNEI